MATELEKLMEIAKLNAKRKGSVRENFARLNNIQKKHFIEDFQFNLIQKTNKTNYA
jgi:hypothetical protein